MAKNTFEEFLPNMVLAMEKPPSFYARLVSLLVMAFVVITILWLIFSKVDIVVTAQGKVVSSGRIKVLQAADAGIVKDIRVRDGQQVSKGDVLIEFDTTVSNADFDQLKTRLNKAQLNVQRIKKALGEKVEIGTGIEDTAMVLDEKILAENKAEKTNKELNLLEFERKQSLAAYEAAQKELEKLQGKVEFNREQSTQKQRYATEGLIARSEAEAAEFQLQDSERELNIQVQKVSEAKQQYSSAKERVSARKTEHKNDLLQALSDANIELNESRQNYIKATQQLTNQTLRAPVDGIVQQLKVYTIGAVVSRADELMAIVPNNSDLEVEAKILNKDIGFVDAEQSSNVKVDAFEYTRYGNLTGNIEWVASDSVLDKEKGPIYPARIKLDETTLPRKVNGRIAKVMPGMSVTVDVVIGQRRLIEYFSGPLLRYQDESLTER